MASIPTTSDNFKTFILSYAMFVIKVNQINSLRICFEINSSPLAPFYASFPTMSATEFGLEYNE